MTHVIARSPPLADDEAISTPALRHAMRLIHFARNDSCGNLLTAER